MYLGSFDAPDALPSILATRIAAPMLAGHRIVESEIQEVSGHSKGAT